MLESSMKSFEEITKTYSTLNANDNRTIILMGESGVGKTKFLETCRKPVLLDCFDPGGYKVLRDAITRKEVFVRDYSTDSYKTPHEFTKWEQQVMRDMASGLFNDLGTYCIDSLTTFLHSLSYQTSRSQKRADGVLAIQDYNIIYNTIRDIVKNLSSYGCDFIMTAHIENEKDDIIGIVRSRIKTFKSLKVEIPLLFDEKWVMESEDSSTGVRRFITTRNSGRIMASSRADANGKWDLKEEPDLKKMFMKLGRKLEDKK